MPELLEPSHDLREVLQILHKQMCPKKQKYFPPMPIGISTVPSEAQLLLFPNLKERLTFSGSWEPTLWRMKSVPSALHL